LPPDLHEQHPRAINTFFEILRGLASASSRHAGQEASGGEREARRKGRAGSIKAEPILAVEEKRRALLREGGEARLPGGDDFPERLAAFERFAHGRGAHDLVEVVGVQFEFLAGKFLYDLEQRERRSDGAVGVNLV
jgi:hypothetical protein